MRATMERVKGNNYSQGHLNHNTTQEKDQFQPKGTAEEIVFLFLYEEPKTWWTFQIFFIFSARGRGRGSPEAPRRGRTSF